MNRQIKFRVWNEEEKRFQYTEYVPTLGFLTNNINPSSFGENNIQQYTGIKDINGMEIYEGDIIESKHYEDWGDTEGFIYRGIVHWNPIWAAFKSLPVVEYAVVGHNITSDYKVIGNIFENKELCPKKLN